MRAFLIFLISGSLQLAQAQFGEFIYEGHGEDFIYKMIPSADGNFYAIGTKTPQTKKRIWLLKLKPTGAMIWESIITPENAQDEELGYSVIPLSDGTFIITGENINSPNFNKHNGMALQVDSLGNIIWERIYEESYALYDAIQVGNEYMCVGWFDKTGSQDYGVLLRIDHNGAVVQNKYIIISSQTVVSRIIPVENNEFLIAGRTNSIGVGFKGIFMRRITSQGGEIWTNSHNTDFSFSGSPFSEMNYGNKLAITIKPDNSIVIADAIGDNEDIGIFSFTEKGTFITEKSIKRQGVSHLPQEIISLPDDQLFLTGFTNTRNSFAYRVNGSGLGIWQHYFRKDFASYALLCGVETPTHFLMAGFIIQHTVQKPDPDGLVLGIGKDGNFLPYIVRGRVWLDSNENCLLDSDDLPLPNWNIQIQATQEHLNLYSDEDGYFEYHSPEDTTTFDLYNPAINTWEICHNPISVFSSNENIDTMIEFLVNMKNPCAKLNLSLTQPDLIRCDTSCLTAMVTNEGSRESEAIQLTLESDPELKLISCSRPFVQNQNILQIQIPAMDVLEENRTQLCYVLDCDVQLGATHEILSWIDPYYCIKEYRGPYYKIRASCQDNQIRFNLQNLGGGGDTAFTYYTVYINEVKVVQHQMVELHEGAPATVFHYPADGHTWRMELEQPSEAPGPEIISATIESCGRKNTNLHDIGFRNAYPPDDLTDDICRLLMPNTPGIGNRIMGSHTGIGRYDLIRTLQPLEYTARAINLSGEIANQAVFEFTLTPTFDFRTFQLQASSAEVRLQSIDSVTIRIIMNDISLPPASSVMVRFSITPRNDLPPDQESKSLMLVEGRVFFDEHGPYDLRAGFQNYSLLSTDLSTPYYTYPKEIKIFGGRSYDFGEALSIDGMENVFMCGTAGSYSDRAGDDFYIIKSNKHGEAQWVNTVGLGDMGTTKGRAVLPSGDGGCFFAGTYWLPGIEDYVNYGYLLYGRLDPSGNLLYRHVMKVGGPESGCATEGALVLTDGNFLIYGWAITAGSQPFYIKINPEGEIIWSKLIEGLDPKFVPFDGTSTHDGGFVVIGDDPRYGQNQRIWRFDGNGVERWSTKIDEKRYPSMSDIVEMSDNRFLAVGTALWQNEEMEYVSGLVSMKFNEQGQMTWRKDTIVGAFGNIDVRAMSLMSDGIVITGDILEDTTNYLDLMVLKLDTAARVEWYRNYGNANSEIGFDVSTTAEDEILIFGYNQARPILYDLQALYLKADKNGFITATEDLNPMEGLSVILFPNPAAEDLHLCRFPEGKSDDRWYITDITGRIILSGQWHDTFSTTISISALLPGMYFISFPNTIYSVKAFVVER